MTRGVVFDALRTNFRDNVAANLLLPTHITRLIHGGKLYIYSKIIRQAQTLIVGDMVCFSFSEPKGNSCAIVMESRPKGQ